MSPAEGLVRSAVSADSEQFHQLRRRISARPHAVAEGRTRRSRQRRVEWRGDAVPVRDPDYLSVQEVRLHVAGVAAQRLPGGVARSTIPSGYWA